MKKIAIGICNNQDYMPSAFFWNFQALMNPQGYQTRAFKGSSTVKSASLNEVTNQALRWGADYIFYMDIDMSFPQDTLIKLLRHDKPMVGGLYHLKKPTFSPVAGWTKPNPKNELGITCINNNGNDWRYDYAKFPEGDENGLVEIEWTGIGCLLVKREVFEKLDWANKKMYDIWNEKLGVRSWGHDINLCMDARKAGFKIFIDRSVVCGHGYFWQTSEVFIDSWYESEMGRVWVDNMEKRTREPNYWNKQWTMANVKDVARTYPVEFNKIVDMVEEGAKVADVGCGIGKLLRRLKAEKDCDVYGYDFSKEAIAKMEKDNGIPGEVQDIRSFNMNGNAGKYDYVIAHHVLEHFEEKDGDMVIKTLAGLMEKDRGHMILGVPIENTMLFEHAYMYTPETLNKLLAKYFKNVDVQSVGTSYIATADNIIGGE